MFLRRAKSAKSIAYPGLGVDTMATEFESYQILDIHTFQTVAWNVSLFLEIRPTSTVNLTGRDAYVFLAYQRLPGPIEHDHDHMMRIKYPHDIRFDVYARALTKGCYHYDSSRDRFINVHDVVGPYHGDVIVQCLTNHLSTFSLGLFTPDVDIDFSFEYVNEHREGDLYNMADNSKADLYHYVVATETGYRMCAGTDSKSERLSPAEEKVSAMYDSMSIHILAETISYIAMYTDTLVTFCLEFWMDTNVTSFRFLPTQSTLKVVVFVLDVGYLAVPTLRPSWLASTLSAWNIPSYEEVVEMDLAKRRNPNVKLPSCWPSWLREVLQLLLTWVLILLFICSVSVL
ncbi:hypothetical protein NECAME_05069 [Necator americanus]|uniref:Uncharacterized protein n=1 Tax=Necator americanus TaxID=51031 RepID=W2SK15_NECAM|nr:hypothetical protein NECAME_05069 [Necator americanus]ETN69883.1 hypothetical protein NECAME_05069 [Necator americanus]